MGGRARPRSLARRVRGNLTLQGIDCTESVIGDRLRVGPLLLEVSQPRIPCAALAQHLGDR